MNVDLIWGAAITAVSVVAVVSPYVAGLPWVKARPGLERFLSGAALAAGRLKQAIPAGSTPAQAQVLIEAEAAKLASGYAQSIAAAGISPAAVISTVEGLVKAALPVGHILPAPVVSTTEDIITQVLARVQASAAGNSTTVTVTPTATPPSPSPVAAPAQT